MHIVACVPSKLGMQNICVGALGSVLSDPRVRYRYRRTVPSVPRESDGLTAHAHKPPSVSIWFKLEFKERRSSMHPCHRALVSALFNHIESRKFFLSNLGGRMSISKSWMETSVN